MSANLLTHTITSILINTEVNPAKYASVGNIVGNVPKIGVAFGFVLR